MRVCTTCEENKDESEFYRHKRVRKGGKVWEGPYSKCKACWYVQTRKPERLDYMRDYHKPYDRRKRAERLTWLEKQKDHPCEDCGRRFPPECMDFDHKDPSEKVFALAQAPSALGDKTFYERAAQEIAKCRLICANCHRIRTAHQQGRCSQ